MITKLGKEIVEESGTPTLAQVGAAVAAVPAVTASRLPVNAYFLNKLIANARTSDLTDTESGQVVKHMAGNKHFVFNKPLHPAFSSYDPVTRVITADRNSYVMAHELGHATSPVEKNPALGYGFRLFTNGLRRLQFPVLAEAANSAQKAWRRRKGLPEEEDSTSLQTAANVGRLSTGLRLAEEAQASLRGLGAIGKVQGKAGVLKALKVFGPAFGTYASGAAATHTVAPWLGGKIGDWAAG